MLFFTPLLYFPNLPVPSPPFANRNTPPIAVWFCASKFCPPFIGSIANSNKRTGQDPAIRAFRRFKAKYTIYLKGESQLGRNQQQYIWESNRCIFCSGLKGLSNLPAAIRRLVFSLTADVAIDTLLWFRLAHKAPQHNVVSSTGIDISHLIFLHFKHIVPRYYYLPPRLHRDPVTNLLRSEQHLFCIC